MLDRSVISLKMKILNLILLCCAVVLVSSCASSPSGKDQWEYRVVGPETQNREQMFNLLGKEGWQLVDTDPFKGYLFRRSKPESTFK